VVFCLPTLHSFNSHIHKQPEFNRIQRTQDAVLIYSASFGTITSRTRFKGVDCASSRSTSPAQSRDFLFGKLSPTRRPSEVPFFPPSLGCCLLCPDRPGKANGGDRKGTCFGVLYFFYSSPVYTFTLSPLLSLHFFTSFATKSTPRRLTRWSRFHTPFCFNPTVYFLSIHRIQDRKLAWSTIGLHHHHHVHFESLCSLL
jgi:hypothetical protein